MNRFVLFCSLPLLLLLTGCWDQFLIKDANLIYTVGVDMVEGGVESTFYIPRANNEDPTNVQGDVYTGIGRTLRDSRRDVDNQVSGLIDSSKIRVVVINKELAEIDLYPLLDLYYRDPRAPLNARVAITNESAKELIKINIDGKAELSDYLLDLIKASEESTFIPELNIQYICPLLLDDGKDFILPLLEKIGEDGDETIRVTGTAMFSNGAYSGVLTEDESVMLNLFNNIRANKAKFTVKVSDKDEELELNNYITLRVNDINRSLNVGVVDDNVEVNGTIKLFLNVLEFPPDNLTSEKKSKEINQTIQEELNKIAQTAMGKLQEANCDYLGIGREVKAFHHNYWKKVNWKEVYPNISFNVTVETEIVSHGIIN